MRLSEIDEKDEHKFVIPAFVNGNKLIGITILARIWLVLGVQFYTRWIKNPVKL